MQDSQDQKFLLFKLFTVKIVCVCVRVKERKSDRDFFNYINSHNYE